MSVIVYVMARRTLTQDDLEYVRLYNGLLDKDIDPPEDILRHLKTVLGDAVDDALRYGEAIDIPEGTDTVEIGVHGRGDVFYRPGRFIEIADLPPDTVTLRICAEH